MKFSMGRKLEIERRDALPKVFLAFVMWMWRLLAYWFCFQSYVPEWVWSGKLGWGREGKTFDKSQKMQMTVIFKNSSVNKGEETKECFHFSLEHVSFRILLPFSWTQELGQQIPSCQNCNGYMKWQGRNASVLTVYPPGHPWNVGGMILVKRLLKKKTLRLKLQEIEEILSKQRELRSIISLKNQLLPSEFSGVAKSADLNLLELDKYFGYLSVHIDGKFHELVSH